MYGSTYCFVLTCACTATFPITNIAHCTRDHMCTKFHELFLIFKSAIPDTEASICCSLRGCIYCAFRQKCCSKVSIHTYWYLPCYAKLTESTRSNVRSPYV